MVEKADDVGIRATDTPKGGGVEHPVHGPEAEGNGERLSALRKKIEQTEAEMAETLNAIQEKISFDHIKEQVKEKLLDTLEGRAREMTNITGQKIEKLGHSLVEAIKEKPMPTILLGIGLGWFLVDFLNSSPQRKALPRGGYGVEGEEMSEDFYQTGGLEDPIADQYRRSGGGAYGYQAKIQGAAEKVRQAAGSVQHQAEDIAGETLEKAKDLGGKIREAVGSAQHQAEHIAGETVDKAKHLSGQVLDRAEITSKKVIEFAEENMLMLSIGAMAIGITAGLLLPKTSREERLLEEARETIADKTRELGHKTMEKAERVVKKAKEAVREETNLRL